MLMIQNSSFLKQLSVILITIIFVGCSTPRYSHLLRAEAGMPNKTRTETEKTNKHESAITKRETNSAQVIKSLSSETNTVRNQKKDDTLRIASRKKVVYRSFDHSHVALPDDSLKIDIKEQKKTIEKLGRIGFGFSFLALILHVTLGGVLGIWFLITVLSQMQAAYTALFLLLSLGVLLPFLIALAGLICCIIALHKIDLYQIRVKNKTHIIIGLCLNIVLMVYLLFLLYYLFFLIY
jgi:hypothetical protein